MERTGSGFDMSSQSQHEGAMIGSEDLLREQAYLVARGVRPLALLGHDGSGDSVAPLRQMTHLEQIAGTEAIPFACRAADGMVDYGFAARAWVVDLYSWLVNADENAVPTKHRHRILGLLLGYDADAIHAHEEQNCGRLMGSIPTESAESVAT
jgi:hypothetical protein